MIYYTVLFDMMVILYYTIPWHTVCELQTVDIVGADGQAPDAAMLSACVEVSG